MTATDTSPKPLGKSEVLVKVLYCSVGAGDVEFVTGEVWEVNYDGPALGGHEIVGIVIQVGERCDYAVGDIVGVGFQSWSCGECNYCRADSPQYCPQQQSLIVDTPGGYSGEVVVDERFVIALSSKGISLYPDIDITSPSALATIAPLMCAGVTVYSALSRAGLFDLSTRLDVAVVGVGGLGHLACKMLAAADHEISAVTTRHDTDRVKQLGVDQIVNHADIDKFASSFDAIVFTSSGAVDWAKLLMCLKPDGKVLAIGSPVEGVGFDVEALNYLGARSIVGSYVGSPKELEAVVRFCAARKILPEIQVFPASKIDAVMEMVRNRQVYFRAVLDYTEADELSVGV